MRDGAGRVYKEQEVRMRHEASRQCCGVVGWLVVACCELDEVFLRGQAKEEGYRDPHAAPNSTGQSFSAINRCSDRAMAGDSPSVQAQSRKSAIVERWLWCFVDEHPRPFGGLRCPSIQRSRRLVSCNEPVGTMWVLRGAHRQLVHGSRAPCTYTT